ncbi:unnamed protein product [Caenorhabditis nigoni]|uniref:Uncharacterized protein n=1 Tax=Caenorhabditis nigoni TaxID=1611254 RepID=A0A2G5UFM9_9PELO|nr:hypothetical protein B9Z55_010359 [Caenorhabditis nigoni]
MESSTAESGKKSKKTTTTEEAVSAETVIIIFVFIGLFFLCCVGVSLYCFYKRKREQQMEQIANVPPADPNQVNGGQPVAAPGQPQVAIIRI